MRKPRILMSIPAVDGTAYYRSYPYYKLDAEFFTQKNPLLSWGDIYNVDICFFQRPARFIDVTNIETCKKFNKKVVIDYDDYCFEVTNETNPAYEYYSREAIHEVMRECIRQADTVTVSTEGLKEALLEEVPTANIIVIPNAVDDEMFSLEPSHHERNKIILLRGGGSHKYDWEAYTDAIIEIMEENPDYTLTVMGFHPEWLRGIPNHQVQYIEFKDVATYFHTLMQLKPQIMIVPLLDDKFNRCKSNIAWIEGTVAGATTIATRLPEFDQDGVLMMDVPSDLKSTVKYLIQNPIDRSKHYQRSVKVLPKLAKVNEFRKDIIELTPAKKYSPNTPEYKPATDLEFHNHNLSHGNCIENPEFLEGHDRLAEWLAGKLRPRTALELGCGSGGTLLGLLRRGVQAYGLEINPISVQYFKDRYPMYENQIFHANLTKERLDNDERGDLVYSIEVFEHLPVDDEWLKTYFRDLSKKFRHFYFSSTPYHTTEAHDKYWGHINLKRTHEWIRLLEESGWKMVSNPKVLVTWDLLLESTN